MYRQWFSRLLSRSPKKNNPNHYLSGSNQIRFLVSKVVEGLNGLENGCLTIQPFVYLAIKVRCKAINRTGHRMKGAPAVYPSVGYRWKRKNAIEKLFVEDDFSFCSDYSGLYLCFADI
jgi:hypothetical protein